MRINGDKLAARGSMPRQHELGSPRDLKRRRPDSNRG
jgi:hypothetical protein